MNDDVIFTPLRFRSLTVKNRIIRASIGGRIDNYDGSGTQARINWEERFARGGVAAIISSLVPADVSGRVQPNHAMLDADDKIPFWRRGGDAVHRHDCPFIVQLGHAGRQRDIPGVENMLTPGLSSTGASDPLHGHPGRAATRDELAAITRALARAARRAREAGLDGIEL